MGELCSKGGIDGLGSWCYGSNYPHAMESVVAIQGANVVVHIVSGVLDELTGEPRNNSYM